MRTILLLLFIVSSTLSTCPDHYFLGCVLRLKAQRVPFERNIVNVVFNIGTEAKLLHTCKVYSATLPCFREKIVECGDDKQRRLLNEVGKMLMFLCSPFSLARQRLVIENQKCISSVLSMPASTGCNLQNSEPGKQVLQCKKQCASRPADFICMMRSWISEQNVCTLTDINDKCGIEAGDLYKEMQTTVFEPQFPVLCDANEVTDELITVNSISTLSSTEVSTLVETNFVMNVTEAGTNKANLIKNVVSVKPDSAKTENNGKNARLSVYRKPPRTFNVTSQPVFASSLRPPVVWTKRPNTQKALYNKEMWRKKSGSPSMPEFSFASTQHPLFTTTQLGATPRSYKVINILKSLLPSNLPSKWTDLFEKSLEASENFAPEDHYNTPPSTENFQDSTVFLTTRPTTILTTVPSTRRIVFTTPPSYYHPTRPLKPTKWKPWYLGGTSE